MLKATQCAAFFLPKASRWPSGLHEVPKAFFMESAADIAPPLNSIDPSSAVFEPVLDVQAFSTFVVIVSVFAALSFRTNQVEGAVQERKSALEKLRLVKSKELAGDETSSNANVQSALNEYELAVKKEEELRNIIPGVVRIVPPSSADAKEEEARAIAKQFLGKDFDIGTTKREEVRSSGVPTLAIVAVLSLFIFQAALFLVASEDLVAMSSFPAQM